MMTSVGKGPVLAGAIAFGAVGIGYRQLMSGYPAKSSDCGVLSPKEQCVVAACADAFFPPGGPIPISGTEAGLVEYMDRFIARLPPTQCTLTKLLFHFIEHGPWVFGPVPKRFTKLNHEQRLRVLDRMRQSPIYFRRIAFLSMRTMLTMGYLAHPCVAEAMRLKHDADPFASKDCSSAA